MAITLFLAAAFLAAPADGLAAKRSGSPHADVLEGTRGADQLFGRQGNDRLIGRAGRDMLNGGPGGDRLRGGLGNDLMRGGKGDDLLLARDGRRDIVNCGPGDLDVAVVDRYDVVRPSCEEVTGLHRAAAPTIAATEPPPTPPGTELQPEAPGDEPEPPVEEPPAEEPPQVQEQLLAVFSEGHGWEGNGVGTYEDAFGPFSVNGGRSYKIVTEGDGAEAVATSPSFDPVDLSHTHISFHAQVSFSNRLDQVRLRLGSGQIETDYAEATIWESDADPIILGSTFEFQSIPLGAFEVVGAVDWTAIDRAQIILTDNELGTVTLYAAGIYAIPTEEQATISFAFDDGHESVYARGLEKLSVYRYPATAYVIADVIDEPGWLSLEQLYALRQQHQWEIGAHAYSVENHNLPNAFDSLEPAELKEEMDSLRDWFDERGFARRTFAYPKGAAGTEVRRLAERDYCAGRATARGPETLPPRDPYTMRGWSINGLDDGAASVEAAIDRAVAEKSWLMLSFHDLVGGTAGTATEFGDDEFGEVVDYVRELQLDGELQVQTVAEALGDRC